MEAKSHWEKIYKTKSSETMSWYQPHATLSLDLIRRVAPETSARIVDVGGGAASLVDNLLADGMTNVSVLDISGAALNVARHRLGDQARRVRWIEGDITTVGLEKSSIDVWHDRAVFHFLTSAVDRAAYVAQVRHAVRPGGQVIVAAFGPNGPLQCSGLPVVRYAPDALHAEFGGAFELLEHVTEDHYTPSGLVQHFVYCHCVLH
ncbi:MULTISPECIES: class I SAM-dependent methyltransferase [unclassified Polaromonas]|jgi:ubiquinone/menaquinone biosynthesis C-methylase UbiE|uniref:class I SAM-dependent methyltransferase n=1 Tax=unclassified Polaromonas TaxID=2638319 RepID=UPI000BCE9378|nr:MULTISPECIES: class I SAM-dependent methyltransferase [unclassified Polaromonas]OYY33277.1 MAG: SAM-dependent methyltransferase [Polaromonas sp. 35-63-35]OYZ17552.1 MAG: SAM-dependent methyltransferase [Polaromonas sp. 16-63-31]OYZ76670.1 MAG: SAM-dependent methyltransferase [Polaromonas sp. 24-63-21]OZA47805.1 MAG: SAM-dependent methyltransferase [Polaromonas sp. 17-63-33]OZA85842.1 MAG: SAM-dependent methyltransferase [Polaromonas sp. 39-63-25]